MSDDEPRYGRRKVDNGWRAWLRDYGALSLLVFAIFYGGVQWNMLKAAEKERDANKDAIDKIVDVQTQRAKELGQVMEGLRLVQDQNRTILQTLLSKDGK